MTAEEKLRMIRDMCDHPVSFNRSGMELARAIKKVLDDNRPIDYWLSDADEPIGYELIDLIHDAVAEEVSEE